MDAGNLPGRDCGEVEGANPIQATQSQKRQMTSHWCCPYFHHSEILKYFKVMWNQNVKYHFIISNVIIIFHDFILKLYMYILYFYIYVFKCYLYIKILCVGKKTQHNLENLEFKI